MQQRVRTLEAFLADVYDRCRVVDDGVVPRSLITSSKHFHRAAHGIVPPNGVRVHVSGIDLIRDEQGTFRVLEDNVRVPSGVSYVLANRSAMRQQWADVLGQAAAAPGLAIPAAPAGGAAGGRAVGRHRPVRRGAHARLVQQRLLRACLAGPVDGRGTRRGPRPGLLGRRGADARHDGERRVDVIYRRVDDEFLDPVQFRADSALGCPGLLTAARAGNVTIANSVGNGVADDKLSTPTCPTSSATTSAKNRSCRTSTPGAWRTRSRRSSTDSTNWSSSPSTEPAARAS